MCIKTKKFCKLLPGSIKVFLKSFEQRVFLRHKLTCSMSIFIYTYRFDHKPVPKTNFISSKLNENCPSLQATQQFGATTVKKHFQNYSKQKASDHNSKKITHSCIK